MAGRDRDPLLHHAPVTRVEPLSRSRSDELIDALSRELHDELAFGEHREDLAVDLQPRGSEPPSFADGRRSDRRVGAEAADELLEELLALLVRAAG
jgi:hypothetical protein